jgi:hypothetical protein
MFRMKIRRFAFVLACAVPVFTAAQATKRPAATTKVLTTYTDPANGVSFKYPAAWTIVREPSFYLPPLISLPQQSPQAVVSLSPSGDYLKTNLGGLEFTYVTLRLPSQASCLQRITEDIREDKPPESVTINGTQFFHTNTGDAGLCHQANRNIYETYRHGACFLFEAAFYTVCPDPDDGRAQLTADQSEVLSRPLDAIIQTVKIRAVK